MKYDDAAWHAGSEFPTDIQADAAATHIGMFVAWAFQHGFASARHLKANADAVAAVQERRMTGRDFVLAHGGGQLADTDLNERGNAFAAAYYEKGFMADWQAFAQAHGLASDYHAPDTWATFGDVQRMLDQRFAEWERGVVNFEPLPRAVLRTRRWWQFGFMLLALTAVLGTAACTSAPASQASVPAEAAALQGAWRAKVTFTSGPLAEMKDLEFLYSYNAGGTMTESSNYDEAANSSPPAYGIWKQTAPHTFQTKYLFYTTKAPEPVAGAPAGSDWWPAGHGVLTETITLSDDGQTYASAIALSTFDKAGAPVAGGDGAGTASGTRVAF